MIVEDIGDRHSRGEHLHGEREAYSKIRGCTVTVPIEQIELSGPLSRRYDMRIAILHPQRCSEVPVIAAPRSIDLSARVWRLYLAIELVPKDSSILRIHISDEACRRAYESACARSVSIRKPTSSFDHFVQNLIRNSS
ncbi:hypothetical protein MB46_07125 [Arthrobacter alpinus]|nr:hypothetical protein MB46_07125 [Arthrobacter alpinus]